MTSPGLISPESMASARESSRYFSTARRSGRAPYFSSYPLSIKKSLHSLENSNVNSRPLRRVETFRSSRSTISVISSRASGLNITRSLRRLRNSGLKTRLVSSRIFSRIFSYSFSALLSIPKPIEVLRWRMSAPTFEVIIKIVLRKSILRPRLSVNRPSSST